MISQDVGTEYELLVKQIYEQLILEDGVNNVTVSHNIKLKGIRSGLHHQIDVYWEFQLAGEIHRVAIECKNYSNSVSIAKIRDFHGVIDDIGDIKGIFVSTNGFQSGAKQFADRFGITLKEIRKPIDSDWDGYIKSINVNLVLIPSPQLKGIDIEFDGRWLNDNNLVLEEVHDKAQKHLREYLDQNKYPPIYDTNKIFIEDFQSLHNKLPVDVDGNNLTHKFILDNRYLMINGQQLIKLLAVIFHYSYSSQTMSSEFIFDGSLLVKSIVKDVKSGDIKFIRATK